MNAPTSPALESTDVVIVGGGPAGSTCARVLRSRGIEVTVVDKAAFPRDKVCAGWITPQVIATLAIDLDDYGSSRTLQPISAFRTGMIDGTAVGTEYRRPVSYGIRRSEFDHYLLERCGARLRLGEPLRSLVREEGGWCVNESVRARILIGAGGHFCPVARHFGAQIGSGEQVIAAQEIEYRLDPRQAADCAVDPERPELYFCEDLKGYGWCFRKGEWLNVGLGREDKQQLTAHVAAFCDWLRRERRVPADLPDRFKGHAYLLYTQAPRPLVADAALLIGDAAGLAYPQSGEGIRPAIESGILAAGVVAAALGTAAAGRQAVLEQYESLVEARFGARTARPSALQPGPVAAPSAWRAAVARRLLGNRWFSRHVVIDRWFLHGQQPALPAIGQAG
jgi:geranylgeranyl reductase family protein